MANTLTRVRLTDAQRTWLRGIYSKLSAGKPVDKRSLLIELVNTLPKDFNPSDIDSRLLRGAVNITVVGLALLDPQNLLVKMTDHVIRMIRDLLSRNPRIKQINVNEISKSSGLAEEQVAIIFEKLSQCGMFSDSGTSYGRVGWASMNINDRAFDSFVKYDSLEQIGRSIVDDDQILINQENSKIVRRVRIAIAEMDSRRIFVVHGHDVGLKHEVALFLSRLSLTPIILHEQTGRGRTIIEKLEAYASVPFAVVLLTPDDVGGKDKDDLKARARQNVVLELGYFYGRLRRDFVSCLSKGVEIPSDSMGIEYIPYDDSGAWKIKLARELSEVFEIDMNHIQ
jgi:predicted nucleotide-binding protein